MGPYGSVGAHIKTGRSPMAQDHFKTPPDPKKGYGMTKSKKYSRVGQVMRLPFCSGDVCTHALLWMLATDGQGRN